jgi:basic membrane protein A
VALVYWGPEAGTAQELVLQGWEEAQREFDFRAATVVPLISDEEDLRALAEAGYDLIITALIDRGGAVAGVAEDFPDTHFVVLDGDGDPDGNVTGVNLVRSGGAYLMGVAAALQTETDRIGFIGGFQQPSTEERRAAFAAGAHSVEPGIVVDAVYLGPYSDGARSGYVDPELARTTAADLYRSGVDVIHHSAAQGVAIGAAAAQLRDETGRELWVIGSEIDEQRLAQGDVRGRFLTSLWKRWDRVMVDIVRLHLADELMTGTLHLGLADGFIDYAVESSSLTPGQISRLEEVKTDIIDGRVIPPFASQEPPRWTREPTFTVNLTFDGRACSVDRRSVNLLTGDVVQITLENTSDTVLASAIFKLADDDPNSFDWEVVPVQTLTAPGGRNAVAIRLVTGSFIADCYFLDEDGDVQPAATGVTLTATFETDCRGPGVESDDPVEVVHALTTAVNNRDPGAVCALFADNGPMMADLITIKDDDRWKIGSTVSDIVVSGTIVEWTVDFTTATGPVRICSRAEIDEGKILWLEPVTCDNTS